MSIYHAWYILKYIVNLYNVSHILLKLMLLLIKRGELCIMIPFSFSDYRKCVKCGKKAVELYDKFNKPTQIKIYPVTKMICSNCGAEYYIKWIDNGNGTKIPICTDDTKIKELENTIIEYSKSKRRKI